MPLDPNGLAIVAALERAGNPDATLHTISGLNHMFQEASTGSMREIALIEQTFSPKALTFLSAWIGDRFTAP